MNFSMINRDAVPQIEQKMINENPRALAVWWFLQSCSNRLGCAVVSQQALKEVLHVKSRQTIWNAVKYLVRNHYIKVGKTGSQNVYILNPNLVWRTARNYGKRILASNGIAFPATVILTKQENRKLYKEYEQFKKENPTPTVDLNSIDFKRVYHGKKKKNGQNINRNNNRNKQ